MSAMASPDGGAATLPELGRVPLPELARTMSFLGLRQIDYEPDLEELPTETRKELDFVLADTLDEVLAAAFDGVPVAPRAAPVAAERQAASSV